MVLVIIIRIEIAWLSGHHFVGGDGDAAYDAVDDDADDADDVKGDAGDGDDDDIA